MLIRFLRNITIVYTMFRRSEKIDHEWFKIALLENSVNPYSFFRTVFLNKQDYLENRIAENVLRHELEHVRQSHSRDIIFFEMLHIVFWFNPVLFLYKWAARINHEYLADEEVSRSISDVKTYANELINFISRRASVPFTSGFSPSMIRLRLLMLNTSTTRSNKNIRMLITLFTSVLLMSFLSFRPAYADNQDIKTKKGGALNNKDIVIDEVDFKGPDFKPLKALVIMDGRNLGPDSMVTVDPQQIKTINILKNRKAIRKYGRSAKNGAVEINTYLNDKNSDADTLKFKPMYTINTRVPEGSVTIPVSKLYSLSIWTYPIFPNQDLKKRWRTIDIMTREYYQIRGKVVQKNGEPVPGALLTAGDNPYKIITDTNGRFLMEDVKEGVVAQLSAEGYEPFNFKVNGVVFTADVTITLDKKDESDQSNISINYIVKNFSGTWKLNKELSKTPLPIINSVYNIHQYGSDSIMMNISGKYENREEPKTTSKFVFNTVKTDKFAMLDNVKVITFCSVSSDGRSFSVTNQVKNSLGLSKEYKNTVSYSLSDDEKQMIIRSYDFFNESSPSGNEFEVLVFDRM